MTKLFASRLAFFAIFSFVAANSAEPAHLRVLDEKMYYLAASSLTEWQEFEGKTPHGRRLDLAFQFAGGGADSAESCTLFIRQDNVKFPWAVLINRTKVGELLPMDALQVNAFSVSAKLLINGENTLSIVAPVAVDDILVGDIRLDLRPREKALSDARLQVKVTDAQTRSGLPCRITLADKSGALMPFVVLDPGANDPSQLIASRTGVVYTRDGAASLGVPPGSYTVYATRGFEYSMGVREVSVRAGATQNVELQIEREVPTPGLIACDTHIHTRTNHGDATLDERMLTIAGEGIELAISTEHNQHVDFIAPQTRTGLLDRFTSVLGNEVTTKAGHFNAFPIAPGSTPPDDKIEDWPTLLRNIRGTTGVQVVTLNHPRDLHGTFIPFGATNFSPLDGEHFRTADFNFDAVEVITSAALQSDMERLYHDWFALLNYGARVSGIGSSDSHDVSRFILGQGRTYVVCDDSQPGKIDIDGACRSFREGRVSASMGLLADLQVNESFAPGDLAIGLSEEIRISATVLGPSWVGADRVELFANGVRIKDEKIAPTRAIQKAKITWTIPRPAQDTHLVVIATGPGVTEPCWAIPRPYQPSSKVWTPRVIGSTNPIWLDADGDGKFTAPRALAAQLLAQAANDPARLVPLLAKHDRAVAIQAASLCVAAKIDLKSEAIQAVLNAAPETVRDAFRDFLASLELRKPEKKAP